ncbi:MAG: hypothetical protein WKF73_12805 [Nocardioidaceae bacterium]
MVTEATKKFRDVFAYGLLGVAALYLLSGLSLLFKSEDDAGPFSERAALFGHVFTHPLLVLSLLGAVLLAVGFGSASKNAKIIVTATLAIASAALLFALISWLSGFGVDSGGRLESFGGVPGAGKIVSILLGLAQLTLLALTAFLAFSAFRSLPKSATKNSGVANTAWGQDTGHQGMGQAYPQNQGYGQSSGYGQGATQAGPGQWQPQQGYGNPQVGYGYAPPQQAQQPWEQPPHQQNFPQGVQQQGSWDPQTGPGQAWSGQGWGQAVEAEAAPEQRPGEAGQPPVAYPADQPQPAAPAAGATAVTPIDSRADDETEAHPPAPQR